MCMYKKAHEQVDFCGVNEWVGLHLTVGKEKCRPVSRAVAVAPRLCTPGNSKTSNSADFGNWGNLRRNRWQQIHSTSLLTVQLQIGSCCTTRRGQTDGLKKDKLGNHNGEQATELNPSEPLAQTHQEVLDGCKKIVVHVYELIHIKGKKGAFSFVDAIRELEQNGSPADVK